MDYDAADPVVHQQAADTPKNRTKVHPPCEQCGLPIPKNSLKRHKQKQCAKRRVPCPHSECDRMVVADNLDHHLAAECEARSVTCSVCQAEDIPFWRLQFHQEEKCVMRMVKCEHCDWTGPLSVKLGTHDLVCPMAPSECPDCFEVMPQHLMPLHVCQKIDDHEDCLICFNKYWDLFRDSDAVAAASNAKNAGSVGSKSARLIMPAILVLGGDRHNAKCRVRNMCTECATKWTTASGLPKCPFCNQEYDGALPLSQDLLPAELLINCPEASVELQA
ncbi:unnamed protein product, partial [Amoebophrya sp. A25]|eukprot:GSA25T00000523001.1